jgi:hypothetical protein
MPASYAGMGFYERIPVSSREQSGDLPGLSAVGNQNFLGGFFWQSQP